MLQLLDIPSLLTSMVGTSFANDCFFKCLVEGFSTQFESGEGYALPDSQAGHFRKFELRLLLDSRDEHDDTAYQREPAEYWGNRNAVMFFRGSVNRSEIKNFFSMGICKSLIGERKAAKNDEENSAPNVRPHVVRSGGYADRLRP
jgi:hypothetical protein